ncbi:uncharacterized protein DS421_17g589780 [Arachis hypogaea]|nr:uncharacterized protein DS421_17g589780 [Arachis hypogaea]
MDTVKEEPRSGKDRIESPKCGKGIDAQEDEVDREEEEDDAKKEEEEAQQ